MPHGNGRLSAHPCLNARGIAFLVLGAAVGSRRPIDRYARPAAGTAAATLLTDINRPS